MMFTQSPCKDCAERNVNCHSEFRKYAEWKKEEARKNMELEKFLLLAR